MNWSRPPSKCPVFPHQSHTARSNSPEPVAWSPLNLPVRLGNHPPPLTHTHTSTPKPWQVAPTPPPAARSNATTHPSALLEATTEMRASERGRDRTWPSNMAKAEGGRRDGPGAGGAVVVEERRALGRRRRRRARESAACAIPQGRRHGRGRVRGGEGRSERPPCPGWRGRRRGGEAREGGWEGGGGGAGSTGREREEDVGAGGAVRWEERGGVVGACGSESSRSARGGGGSFRNSVTGATIRPGQHVERGAETRRGAGGGYAAFFGTHDWCQRPIFFPLLFFRSFFLEYLV